MTYEYDEMKDEQLTLKAEYEDLLRMYEASLAHVGELTAENERLAALLAQTNATYVGMEAEINRLTDALVYVNENAGNWQTQDNIWPVIAGALKEQDNG